jgi:spore coat polysaccharide biosynthesis predicted glycosyltransferase SpsG
VTVILGRGYARHEALQEALSARADRPHTLTLLHDVQTISQHMHSADLVFTSAGRTVYEVASLGTPLIVLAQNERELLHSFARLENGVVNLGLGSKVSDQELMKTFRRLCERAELRAELQQKLLCNDLKGGVTRTIQLILDAYEAWEAKQNNP